MGINEIWKPVPGFEDRYEVSNIGNVRSLARTIRHGYEHRATKYLAGGPIKPTYRLKKGIRQAPHVNLHKPDPTYASNTYVRRMTLASLVYTAFIGVVPPGHVVRLKDGDVDNVVLTNLIMVSRKENRLLNNGR